MNTINHSGGNQHFNFNRFSALLKTYIVENAKTLTMYTLVLIGVCVVIGIFTGYNLGNDRVSDADTAVTTMSFFLGIVYSFCFAVSGSLAFSTMQTRASRISTLMLPASMLEKYLARIVVYLFMFSAAVIVSCAAGEGARYLFSRSSHFFSILTIVKELPFSMIAYAIGSVLASNALYTLGSAFWPKHSFFKTFIFSMVVGMFFGTILISVSISDNQFLKDVINMQSWSLITVEYVWALLLYFLAWLRFRRTQIVQRFMSI